MPTSTTRHLLIRESSGAVVARVAKLSGFWKKGRGVIGRPPLAAGEGVWLPGVASVHTFFVRGALDILFLDADLRTVAVRLKVPSWKPLVTARGAHHVIELGAGTLDRVYPAGEQWEIIASPAPV
jgi:uncharacterized membrane protein (UPF0127 family)